MDGLTREQATLVTASLMMLGAVAGSFALYWTSALMVPFVLSLVVSYLVGPIVDLVQTRLRAPRWAAILAAFFAIAGGAALIVMLLWTSIRGLAENYEVYSQRVSDLGNWGLGLLDEMPEGWVPEEWTADEIDVDAILATLDVQAILATLGDEAGNLLGVLSALVTNGALVVLFAVFLVIGRAPYEHREGMWGEIDSQVQSYLVTKFVMSAGTGVMTWVLLALLGLDLALVFGFLAFLLNFIPNVGSVVAMILPLPIALIQFDSLTMVFLVLALPGSVQFVIGNVVEPRVMGDNLGLHPITVLLALIFWGQLWGVAGLFLSVPLTSIAKIVLLRFETTRPVARFLEGHVDVEAGEPA